MPRGLKAGSLKKPTKESVYSQLAAAKSYWGLRVAEQQIDYILYTMQEDINVPDGYNKVYPPSGNVIINTLADHVAADIPQMEVPQMNQSQSAELRSERVEKGLEAAIRKWVREETNNQIRTGVQNLGWAGMAVSQGPIFDKDAWGPEPLEEDFKNKEDFEEVREQYEITKKTIWPFWWRMVDPRYCFPDPGTIGKEWVILEYQRPVGGIKAQWPTFKGKLPQANAGSGTTSYQGTSINAGVGGQLGGGTSVGAYGTGGGFYLDTDYVPWIEYWDREWRVYIAAGEVIDISRHRYGKPPFQIRSAGLGNESSMPHEQFRSILFPARSLIRQEAAAMSQFDAMMRNTAWSQIITPLGSLFDQIVPGTVKQLRREDIELTKTVTELNPSVLTALGNEIEIIQAGIENATFPSVVRGVKAPGIGSGYGQNSLVAQARIRFGTVAASMESLLEEFFSDLLRCVENVVEEVVPVWNNRTTDAKLDPDDIRGYYHVKVTLNPKLPQDRANEIAIGMQLLQIGAIDMDTFLQEFAGFQQPEEMRARRMRDQILASPAMQEFLRLVTLDEMGITDWVTQKAATLGLDPLMVMQSLGILNPENGAGGTQPTQNAPGASMGAPSGNDILAGKPGTSAPNNMSSNGLDQRSVANAAGMGQLYGARG